MKLHKKTALTIAMAMASAAASAQVANYALQFDTAGSVDCGALTQLDGAESYTLQLWVKPAAFDNDARLVQRGEDFVLSLNAEGIPSLIVGDVTFKIDTKLTADQWQQLTVTSDKGAATAFIDGRQVATGTAGKVPASTAPLKLGGGYNGAMDEVRVWDYALPEDYNRFITNTLNEWVPDREHLLAYYKMDYHRLDNLVEYTAVWTDNIEETNNHGIISKGVTRIPAADNTKMPYLINGAYTANERFWDRGIPREQYLVSNDLIILGIQSYNDGHLDYVTPNTHAEVKGAEYVEEFAGRKGVLHFKGDGSRMTAPATAFQPTVNDLNNWSFMTWIYIDNWKDGAYIMRQESDDHTKGISVRLGAADTRQLYVRINGTDYLCENRIKVGEWMHLAITPNNSTLSPIMSVNFIFNGKGLTATEVPEKFDNKPVGADNLECVIGDNFDGYLDETATWAYIHSSSDIKKYSSEGLPMPGLSKVVTADVMFKALSYYRYDDAANPGYSSYSQDEWLRIMKSAYDGYTGYVTRISVKSHDGWENTIANANRRAIFAKDLAKLVEPYDGCELDLEWIYGPQTNLGLLAEEIRKQLPEGKTFFISCHNVAYQFPKDKMQYVDGFTFQQYGPQRQHSYYSHFQNMCNTFVNYGFPAEKIVGSYATTTSVGHSGASADTKGHPIKGVRDGFFDAPYTPDPSLDVEYKTINDYDYYFNGPLQTYKRAKYIMDNNLGGIFYWDMGNDVPFENPYNLAKNASYALGANVDRIVNGVTPNHAFAGITLPEADFDADAPVEYYNLQGMRVHEPTSGVYIVKQGRNISKKIIK